jgi:beta-lactamase regulating signal transducer with metallopeptidase domain
MMPLLSVLLNSLWEGCVIAFAAWIVLRIARNANATTRYLIWTCALIATVVLPLATVFAVDFTRAAQVSGVSTTPAGNVQHVHVRVERVPRSVPQSTQPLASPPSVAMPQRLQVRVPQNVVWAALALWAAVALWQIVRFSFALVALEKLKRNATPLPIEYREQLHRWNSTDRVHAGVRLCVSDEILVPIAVGLFDAMILVPESLLQRLQPDDVDRILLHEFAHLRRRDDWIHAFQRIVCAVLFFNPAVLFIARQMDLEREVSCDDSVLERDGLQPVPYATCLTKMAEIVAWPYAPLAAPGVFNTRRNLSIRVERLLTSARDNRTRIAAMPALAALVVIAGAGVAGASVSPAFAFAIPAFEPKTHSVPPHVARRSTSHEVAHTITHATKVEHVQQLQIVPLHQVALVTPSPQPARSSQPVEAKTKSRATVKVKTQVKVTVPSPTDPPARDGDYIQELANAGYAGLSIDDLVQLKAVGVDAAYIRSIANTGFGHPSVRELVELRSLGITPDYIGLMRGRFSGVTAQQLTEMRSVGVTPQYIDEISGAGYPNLSPRELVELRALGIDAAFIRKAADHGFKNLSVEKLVELKSMGLL